MAKISKEAQAQIMQELSRPFPSEAIQRTKGSDTHKGYDTTGVGYIWISQRFNEVLGIAGWGIDKREISVKEGTTRSGKPTYEATKEVIINLLDEDKNVWASRSAIGGHVSFTLADSMKGAETNAFKKCAALFGCNWQTYAGTLDDDNTPVPEQAAKPTKQKAAINPEREEFTRLLDRLGPELCKSVREKHKGNKEAVLKELKELEAKL